MEDFASLAEGVASQLGRTFILAGLLPAFLFVAVNQFLFFPVPWNFFPGMEGPLLGVFSGAWITALLLAFGLAMVLLPLNLVVTRVFEGLLPSRGLMRVLLFPFMAAERRAHRRYYQPIADKRAERLQVLTEYELTGEYDDETDFEIQDRLEELHRERERFDPVARRPYAEYRLLPTSYGNAWAVMEEYPLSRYGMDGTLFWPYIRTILTQENNVLLEQIDSQKLLVDVATNMALLALLAVVEGLVFFGVTRAPLMLLTASISLILFAGFYEASVGYVRSMATMVTQSYDLYRLHLLDALGLARPVDLDEEYWLWTRLAAFIRRGEPFYFDLLDRADEILDDGEPE